MESALSCWEVSWPSLQINSYNPRLIMIFSLENPMNSTFRTRCPVPMANGSVRVSNGDCHFFAQVHNNLVRYHADPFTLLPGRESLPEIDGNVHDRTSRWTTKWTGCYPRIQDICAYLLRSSGFSNIFPHRERLSGTFSKISAVEGNTLDCVI